MIKPILLATTLFSTVCMAEQGDIDFSITYGKLQHEWTFEQGNPKFDTDLYGVGVNYWVTDNWSLGLIYNDIKPTYESGDFNPLLKLEFEHNYGYEIKYKAFDFEYVELNIGYGKYWMPTDQVAYDENGGIRYDIEDDDGDDGYFVEAFIPLSNRSSIGVKYAIYSAIHSWDETTKALQLTYKFTF